MKIKLIEVGDGLGTAMLPLPKSVVDAMGWKEGDELLYEITAFRGQKTPHIIISKVETKA